MVVTPGYTLQDPLISSIYQHRHTRFTVTCSPGFVEELVWSSAIVHPHDAGATYIRRDMVVASATTCSALTGSPYDFNILRAHSEEQQVPRTSATCKEQVEVVDIVVHTQRYMYSVKLLTAQILVFYSALQQSFGIQSTFLNCFVSYLSKHTKYVLISSVVSVITAALFGVPEGSVQAKLPTVHLQHFGTASHCLLSLDQKCTFM